MKLLLVEYSSYMQKEVVEIIRTKCPEVIPPFSWLKLTMILFLLTLGLPIAEQEGIGHCCILKILATFSCIITIHFLTISSTSSFNLT